MEDPTGAVQDAGEWIEGYRARNRVKKSDQSIDSQTSSIEKELTEIPREKAPQSLVPATTTSIIEVNEEMRGQMVLYVKRN